VETCYISCSLLSEKEVATLNTGSLYDLLARRGRVPVTSEQSIEAALVNADDAALLNMEAGCPVMQFERLSFDAQGDPVEFVVSSYRGDKYRVYALLRR
jgi:GntR family transcriptional regulator